MNFVNPNYIILLPVINPDTGKRKIKFLGDSFVLPNYESIIDRWGVDNVYRIPCGICEACKANRARTWAVRLSLEAEYHKKSYFVTLTYDNFHLPNSGNVKTNVKLCKDHFHDFIKKLRNDGQKIRYFSCGERGELNDRLHHHCILFGLELDDLEFLYNTSNGAYYHSSYLSKVWNRGNIIITEFEFATGAYTSSYILSGSKKTVYCLMSKKPGLGFQYIFDNVDSILEDGRVYGDFGSKNNAPVPRSFLEFISDKLGYDVQCLKDINASRGVAITRSTIVNNNLKHYEDVDSIAFAKLKSYQKKKKIREF